MERISSYQLFILTLLFQIGTTIIFGFASNAGRDGWLSAIISSVIGTMFVIMYTVIARLNPGLTLVEWFPAQLGKWLGTPLSWMYPLMLLYDAGRIMGDIKDLLAPAILPKTPKILICSLFLSLIAYVVISGIEVLGRLGEIVLPVILIFIVLEIVLILGSKIVNIDHVLPIAGKGWGRIWKSVWPLGITQTFGETLDLAMIWPLVRQQKKILKVSVLSCIFTCFTLAILDFMAISVLGEGNFSRSIYPLFKLIQQISIADFLENLDALAVLFFLTTAFFKVAVQVFGATYAIQKLTYAKSNRGFVIPSVIIVLYLGMTMAESVLDHIEAGLVVMPYNIWIHLLLGLPLLLLITSLIRKKLASRGGKTKIA